MVRLECDSVTRLFPRLAHLDTGWVYKRFSARSAPGMLVCIEFRRVFSYVIVIVIVYFDFRTIDIKYLSSKEILCFVWVNRRHEIPGGPGYPTEFYAGREG